MPNLQMHQLRAAAVGAVIAEQWKKMPRHAERVSASSQRHEEQGRFRNVLQEDLHHKGAILSKGSLQRGGEFGMTSIINKDTVITVLLLHDMGNIIKFELDRFPQFLGEENKRLAYWKEVQQSFIDTYGNDEHTATFAIAKEIGIPDSIQVVLENMGSSNLSKVMQAEDYHAKICIYSDLRVAPMGVVSVNKRFDDLIERYRGRNHGIANIEKTEMNRKYCLEVEKQLQEYCSIDLNEITDEMISPYIKKLRKYEIVKG